MLKYEHSLAKAALASEKRHLKEWPLLHTKTGRDYIINDVRLCRAVPVMMSTLSADDGKAKFGALWTRSNTFGARGIVSCVTNSTGCWLTSSCAVVVEDGGGRVVAGMIVDRVFLAVAEVLHQDVVICPPL